MNWKEYTEKAKTTALYDTREKTIHCTAFSIIEEVDEFFEKEWELFYMNTPEANKAAQHELADIAWGLAVLTDHYGYDPSKREYSDRVLVPNLKSFASFAKALNKSARDDNWNMSEEKRKIPFCTFCDELYNWMIHICTNRGWNFSDVLTMNIEKLAKRKENGVLGGDGDSRGEEV